MEMLLGTKLLFLKNYDPVTLHRSVVHVNAQFELLYHIKSFSKVKILMPLMDEFIQFMV